MQDNNKKFSFALPSKSSSKPKLAKPPNASGDNGTPGSAPESNEISNPQYVTEFDSSTVERSTDSKSCKLVIPPKENEFWTYKRTKNIDLALRSASHGIQELRFEVESEPHGQDPGIKNMSYGLNIRRPASKEGNKDVSTDMSSDGCHRSRESIDSVLLRKLREDLHRLPDDEGLEQFEEVPVEGFGAAVLAGYGWKEGMGIGKNAKGDVKVVEYKPRGFRAGLGVSSDNQIRYGDRVSPDVSGAD